MYKWIKRKREIKIEKKNWTEHSGREYAKKWPNEEEFGIIKAWADS